MSVYSLWSPYGAYELKSKYQRNFIFGTGIVTTFVLLILLVSWIATMKGDEIDSNAIAAVVIKTVADLGPPPSIARKPPQVKVEAPTAVAPKVGIPKPVADDEVLDDDVVLATKDELAEIVAPDISTVAGEGTIEIDIDDDYLPAPDEFIPLEIQPEMIRHEVPEYPRLAKQAGITGIVWVNAALDEQGKVIDVVIAKSSGTVALDEAAAKAAWKCTFKPGIQNGRPVRCRVVYKVDFVLDI
jgi:protein TonB